MPILIDDINQFSLKRFELTVKIHVHEIASAKNQYINHRLLVKE